MPGTAAISMYDKIFLYLLAAVFFVSCSTSSDLNRLGTGKPKFSSLEVEGISCFLSSENGNYSPGKPLKLIFRVKNVSKEAKNYSIEKNKFLVLNVRNEFSESIVSSDVPADRFIGGGNFNLDPDEERTFEITVDTSPEAFKAAGSINCQLRLFFLPKQFRRNAVSIYVEKK
jgi:hypothetical protein